MEAPGKDTLQPAEWPAGCTMFLALKAVTHAGVGFGDVAVFGLFLLLLISLAHK